MAAEATALARTAGAANTLVRRPDGGWLADNTDVAGIVQALRPHLPPAPGRAPSSSAPGPRPAPPCSPSPTSARPSSPWRRGTRRRPRHSPGWAARPDVGSVARCPPTRSSGGPTSRPPSSSRPCRRPRPRPSRPGSRRPSRSGAPGPSCSTSCTPAGRRPWRGPPQAAGLVVVSGTRDARAPGRRAVRAVHRPAAPLSPRCSERDVPPWKDEPVLPPGPPTRCPGGPSPCSPSSGTALGWATGRELATGGYRIDDDEADGARRPALVARSRPRPALRARRLARRRPRPLGRRPGIPPLRLAVGRPHLDRPRRPPAPDRCRLARHRRARRPARRRDASPTAAAAGLGALIGMALLSVIFYLSRVLTGARGVGFGDVRLSLPVGLLLGWLGLRSSSGRALATFAIGGVMAVASCLAAGPAARRSSPTARRCASGCSSASSGHPRSWRRRPAAEPGGDNGRHAALADRGGVARPGPRRDDRGAPGGHRRHHGGPRRRARPPPARIRPRRPDVLRA